MDNNETLRKRLESLLTDFESSDIDEADVIELKNKIKKIEKKVKENNKPKTITISAKDHEIIKKHCLLYNLNIGDWASKILLKEIKENDCTIIDGRSSEEVMEENTKDLLKKYFNTQTNDKSFIKTNKIVLDEDLRFNGYSIADANPIYEIRTNGDINRFKESGIDVKLSSKSEVSANIFTNFDLEVVTDLKNKR